MNQLDATRAALVRLVREEGARVVATLIRMTGDVQLAEDAVQDAAIRALEVWPVSGLPDSPRAWLTVVARRRALDIIRREASRDRREAEAVRLARVFEAEPPDSDVPDDLLRLIFTCCHPALSLDTQIALSLRTLCGLSTAEVARALLVSEATMLKRLTRAKQKISRAGIPFRIPAAAELPDRVAGVAACVYLMFNEGYAATSGDDPLRRDLLDEAIRLGRLLHSLMPDDASLTGLLALMLLHDSRRDARVGADGELVLLADQDRSRWRRDQIREGVELLGDGLARTPQEADPYVVQAAIAACHALAGTSEETSWPAIVSWYDVLLTVQDTPVVRLNRAVALAERDGPAAGLAAVDDIAGLESYALWHATRAVLLDRLGRRESADAARAAALALEANEAVRRQILAGPTS
ncbi:RNA polymerase sigma factor [Pengzhenrongella phosphoraccumulans]|uniref:RNA polymerase sigma factor n=1 Tax=Pengzhenrongella phosphoraccumulans TaxID=3114394 RepID=UPI00388F04AD